MRIVLLGVPGSGKKTQAKLISENFNIPHISFGDIFRYNIIQETALGLQAKESIDKEELVCDVDKITISMIEKRLNQEECSEGFILDGFPGNISQLEDLREILEKKGQHIDRVLFFDIPKHVISDRIKGRQICNCCGAIYHSKFNPSKYYNECDMCRGTLIQRKEDDEVIKNRTKVYLDSIEPILNYYGDGGPLLVINGYGEISDVYNIVDKALNSI